MKKLKISIFKILLIVIISIGCFVLINIIQESLFLPQDYIIWIFKYPYSRLVFIYEFYLLFIFSYNFNKYFRETVLEIISLKKSFIKRYKIFFLSIFIILNIALTYAIIYNVTVITNNKIINYTFLSPKGKEYSYSDVVKIYTGVYGKKLYLPFTHSKGDFYYVIQLNDGTKIDLAEMGGSKNDVDLRFIIEKLDSQYVNMGISKESNRDNFKYCINTLDKIYTDKIRIILENVKEHYR